VAKIEGKGPKIPEKCKNAKKCKKWRCGIVKIHVPAWYKLYNN